MDLKVFVGNKTCRWCLICFLFSVGTNCSQNIELRFGFMKDRVGVFFTAPILEDSLVYIFSDTKPHINYISPKKGF